MARTGLGLGRVMGMEAEYGLLAPAALTGASVPLDPFELGARLIHAHGRSVEARGEVWGVRWDYSGESPLRDARGFELDRSEADASMLTDGEGFAGSMGSSPGPRIAEGDAHIAQRQVKTSEVVRLTDLEKVWQRGNATALVNGARFYLDHGHPEYATPECVGAAQTVLYDRAGDEILVDAAKALGAELADEHLEIREATPALVFKNNTDNKGAAYGTHENYLLSRHVDFDDVATALIPFLVTRPVLVGPGRVGLGVDSSQTSATAGFQLSARADFVQQLIGLETTMNRPVVNTRDEPHTDPERWRRLHVVASDANIFDSSNWLKLAITDLVLGVLEARGLPEEWQSLQLTDAVADMRTVSRDLTLKAPLTLKDGRNLTAIEIQRVYCQTVTQVVREETGIEPLVLDPNQSPYSLLSALGNKPDARYETALTLAVWADLLDRLGENPLNCTDVEWVAKLGLLEATRKRRGLAWDAALLQAIDLQWTNLGDSLGVRLSPPGSPGRVFPAEQVARAREYPPAQTRAYFRGRLISDYPREVFSAGWHSMVVDMGEKHLRRIPLTDVQEWTEGLTGEILDEALGVRDVIEQVAKV
ncbi:MAG: proteasome accessory factor PafA2 family protein [Actinomycetaceae bacterium]|nr:proteasome accessory factor PafA2 family protein [Actinomycetaceae bacterium]